ncbi:MAG: PilZ domain-containing protein [Sphingomonas sp.]
MATRAALASSDDRALVRDEVHYRARGIGGDGQPFNLLIVNISAMGLMARCETPLGVDDRIRVLLPVIGGVMAQIRWSLGGRIGCELEQTIALADYYELLAVLMKGK